MQFNFWPLCRCGPIIYAIWRWYKINRYKTANYWRNFQRRLNHHTMIILYFLLEYPFCNSLHYTIRVCWTQGGYLSSYISFRHLYFLEKPPLRISCNLEYSAGRLILLAINLSAVEKLISTQMVQISSIFGQKYLSASPSEFLRYVI